ALRSLRSAMELKAVYAGPVGFAVAALLTPLVGRFARSVGAVDEVKDRGLARDAIPLLGGLAIFAGALVAGILFLPDEERTRGILQAAALITPVGAIDDVRELHPLPKLLGQVAAAVLLVHAGVDVTSFTFPFLHHVDLGAAGDAITVIGLVLLMNV